MQKLLSFFWVSIAIAVVSLGAVFWYGGVEWFLTAALLAVLEITLSFDNAVVNARVLRKMNAAWQKRFLTWGILIAVVVTRLILPILIVSIVVWASPWAIATFALFDPVQYGNLLAGAQGAIHAFGAAFLILVSLKYFFDTGKKVHWIHSIEKRLASWGRVESIEIALALTVMGVISFLVPAAEAATVLIAGMVGVVIFVAMEGITSAFSIESDLASKGLALFIYLNVLDSAFSLDSVVGAFALTNAIPVIVVGLGIGAYFVRSLTVYMVREHTLDALKYLEHGAHWAIFGLAASMFVSLVAEVPEIITGSIGIVFVVAAYWSSIRLRN
jgi:hypothetical protein